MRGLKTVFFLSLISLNLNALAQIKVDITRPADNAIPFAVAPFAGSFETATIIAADLNRSGRFKVISPMQIPQQINSINQITPALWQSLNVTYAVAGSASENNISFELGNVLNKQLLDKRSFNTNNAQQTRRVAHQIADIIFEKITGIAGAFDSRVAYVETSGRNYALVVADADGFSPRAILNSKEPIFSPAWSPNGSQLAYSTLEGKRSSLVVQDLYSGNRRVISAAPGINSAPSWSPDGNSIALTLSKDGNPEIYIIAVNSGALTRLTNHPGIDTEPSWGRDGYIYFTSDRGGQPQIYRVSSNGGATELITSSGNYNAQAAVSPDGKYLVNMQRVGSNFGIAITNLATRTTQRLSNGGQDESPSFSGNGQMIIYASKHGLEAISTDGKVRQTISNSANIRDPAWSPKLP